MYAERKWEIYRDKVGGWEIRTSVVNLKPDLPGNLQPCSEGRERKEVRLGSCGAHGTQGGDDCALCTAAFDLIQQSTPWT